MEVKNMSKQTKTNWRPYRFGSTSDSDNDKTTSLHWLASLTFPKTFNAQERTWAAELLRATLQEADMVEIVELTKSRVKCSILVLAPSEHLISLAAFGISSVYLLGTKTNSDKKSKTPLRTCKTKPARGRREAAKKPLLSMVSENQIWGI